MSKKKKRKEALLYLWGSVVFAAVILLGATYFYYLQAYAPPKLAKDGCPTDSQFLSGHTAIVIDKTDRLTALQKDSVEVSIRNTIFDLPSYHRVSVFAVSSNPSADTRPILSLCSPRTFDERTDSEITVGKQFLEKVWRERFERPIIAVVNELTSSNPAESSPILEMIQVVKVNAFERNRVPTDKPQNLVIYSDFLHHTSGFSLYRRPAKYASLVASPYGVKALPDLTNLNVTMNVLLNRPELQRDDLISFWRTLILDRRGRTEAVKYLQG